MAFFQRAAATLFGDATVDRDPAKSAATRRRLLYDLKDTLRDTMKAAMARGEGEALDELSPGMRRLLLCLERCFFHGVLGPPQTAGEKFKSGAGALLQKLDPASQGAVGLSSGRAMSRSHSGGTLGLGNEAAARRAVVQGRGDQGGAGGGGGQEAQGCVRATGRIRHSKAQAQEIRLGHRRGGEIVQIWFVRRRARATRTGRHGRHAQEARLQAGRRREEGWRDEGAPWVVASDSNAPDVLRARACAWRTCASALVLNSFPPKKHGPLTRADEEGARFYTRCTQLMAP